MWNEYQAKQPNGIGLIESPHQRGWWDGFERHCISSNTTTSQFETLHPRSLASLKFEMPMARSIHGWVGGVRTLHFQSIHALDLSLSIALSLIHPMTKESSPGINRIGQHDDDHQRTQRSYMSMMTYLDIYEMYLGRREKIWKKGIKDDVSTVKNLPTIVFHTFICNQGKIT